MLISEELRKGNLVKKKMASVVEMTLKKMKMKEPPKGNITGLKRLYVLSVIFLYTA